MLKNFAVLIQSKKIISSVIFLLFRLLLFMDFIILHAYYQAPFSSSITIKYNKFNSFTITATLSEKNNQHQTSSHNRNETSAKLMIQQSLGEKLNNNMLQKSNNIQWKNMELQKKFKFKSDDVTFVGTINDRRSNIFSTQTPKTTALKNNKPMNKKMEWKDNSWKATKLLLVPQHFHQKKLLNHSPFPSTINRYKTNRNDTIENIMSYLTPKPTTEIHFSKAVSSAPFVLTDCLIKSVSSMYDIFSRDFRLPPNFALFSLPHSKLLPTKSVLTSSTSREFLQTTEIPLIDSQPTVIATFAHQYFYPTHQKFSKMKTTTTTAISLLTEKLTPSNINKFSLQLNDNRKINDSKLKQNNASMIAIWQLYNHCSFGFLQNFLSIINANGRMRDVCLINFFVHSHANGAILLEQVRTHRFLCFNRKQRLIAKPTHNNYDPKCSFYEHLTHSGYTLLESAYERGLFIGFNHKGHLLHSVKLKHPKFQRCFHFSKMEVERSIAISTIANSSRTCDSLHSRSSISQRRAIKNSNSIIEKEKMIYNIAKELFLKRIEI